MYLSAAGPPVLGGGFHSIDGEKLSGSGLSRQAVTVVDNKKQGSIGVYWMFDTIHFLT